MFSSLLQFMVVSDLLLNLKLICKLSMNFYGDGFLKDLSFIFMVQSVAVCLVVKIVKMIMYYNY